MLNNITADFLVHSDDGGVFALSDKRNRYQPYEFCIRAPGSDEMRASICAYRLWDLREALFEHLEVNNKENWRNASARKRRPVFSECVDADLEIWLDVYWAPNDFRSGALEFTISDYYEEDIKWAAAVLPVPVLRNLLRELNSYVRMTWPGGD